jgi:replication-associated recombination protein RarA
MESKYPHIHDDFQRLMSLSKEDKLQAMHEPFWIGYPKTTEIIQLMGQLMNRPKKPRMQNLLIIGEPHMGKTSLATQFSFMHQDSNLEDDIGMTKVQKPVLLANVQNSDDKDLYIAILEKFWTPFRPTDTRAKLRHQVLHLMRECNVKILILDEIHNLLRGTAVKQRIMMDTIKNLSNELMIPIVGIGTQDASMILASDPQHASRFDVIKLSKWEMDKNFRGLLQAFEKRLPLKKPSHLASKEKAPLLHMISGGNLGDLHRLLIACASYAIEKDIEEITVEIIQHFKKLKPTDTRTAREVIFDSD